MDEAEAEVKEIESELDEAQDEIRELERPLKSLVTKEPRQKRVKSDAPHFTPAAKEAMIESMFDYLAKL